MFNGNIRRILLVRTDRLGDVVLTLPMLPALRTCFPDAHIAMLLRHYTGDILRGNPYADELLWYDDGAHLIPFRTMVRTLRERRFDAVVVVYPTLRLAWLMFRSGIPVRVGTGYRSYSLLFNRRVYEHRKDARRHEVEYNLRLLERLGCTPAASPEFRLQVTPEEHAVVARVLREAGTDPDRPLVVLHPGSGGSAREWGDANFARLAARLAGSGDVQVVVTGGPAEQGRAEAVAAAAAGSARNIAGLLTVRELAALLSRTAVFVSNSTGPIHIAAAMGAAVVGFYPQHPAMSARRWGPWTDRKVVFTPDRPVDCSDCAATRGVPCACMEGIPVEEVDAAVRRCLHMPLGVERREG